jgi:heavy metal translocating P-type ATPase
VTLLYRLMPNKARLVVEGRERFVSVDALEAGAVFRVKSGERIPADGVVLKGRSHADESVLTGESAPRPKAPGDAVVCGSVNTGGVLEISATRVGAASTLAQMVRTVEQAAGSRTRMERSVDRAARLFIPAVLAVAVATFAGWTLRTGEPAEALMHAIAVLVIACPCALGIATPLALAAAVTAAARRGILVSDTRVLETIHKVDMVVMDKTGTATEGVFTLLETAGDTSRMAELAALEGCSEHPIGKAIVRHAASCTEPGPAGTPSGSGAYQPSRQPAARLPEVRDVTVHTGMGIAGRIGETRYFIGNRRMAEQMTGTVPGTLDAGPHVYFGWDGVIRGWMRFGDRVRPEAAALCAELRRRGIRTVLLSGDSLAATAAVAEAIGAAEWRAEATPEGKIEILRHYQQAGAVVAMVGDGVNDAPSLAQADLGIALGSGADIAMQAAPLVLMNNSLGAVVETLDLARRTFRIVRQNLFWAFIYNLVGISLAVAGVLSPILAAAAMVLSSLSVIGNSRRLAAG